MRKRKRTSDKNSDSFSDDDVPLKVLKNGYTEDSNSYASLCRHSFEACEFCDRISSNRYSSLVHNVKHIIIPLLKQNVVQCQSCLHHFPSDEDLRMHTLKKHPSFGKTEPRYFGNPNAVKTVPSNKLEIQPFSRLNSEVRSLESSTDHSDDSSVPIKNRLVFEDDLIILNCDRLLNDLTTDCKVNLEVFGTPWLNNKEFSANSVHYDELVKPGVYRCKKCGKGFPIRYEAIIHETSHLTFKNSQIIPCNICNEYITGGIVELKRHYLNYHKEKCKKQNSDDEYDPYKKNNSENGKKSVHEFVSEIILCELCFSFCKNTAHLSYECVKTISELGKRYKCDKCGMHFFEIKLVKRILHRRTYTHKKKKIKSNEDRLKMIKSRFKMLRH